MGQNIVQRNIRSWELIWHVTMILLKGEDLNQNLKVYENAQLGRRGEQISVTQTY